METKSKPKIELLIPYYRARSNGESEKARTMFRKFVSGHFSYDEISNHPDYPVYASAEVLSIILPLIIDEMIARKDEYNFLIYPIISAFDPEEDGRSQGLNERFQDMCLLIEKSTIQKFCKLLSIIQEAPPVSIERLERISAYWNPIVR